MSGRGAFFFRIIQTLGDENEELRHLATFYLQQRLLKRAPRVMQQHFIEAIFHFNEYEVSCSEWTLIYKSILFCNSFPLAGSSNVQVGHQ
jgi:hypothetical protein